MFTDDSTCQWVLDLTLNVSIGEWIHVINLTLQFNKTDFVLSSTKLKYEAKFYILYAL